MPNLTVYGIPQSTYVRTVRLLLAEANIDYDLKEINIFNGENKTDDYLAKHPFGKVPAIEIDREQIYETVAITYFINEEIADGKYSPADVLTQARMLQIMAIVDNYLYPPAIGTIVIQNLIVPSQGGQTDKEAVKQAVAPTQKALKAIEDLYKGSPFLLGSEISLSDFHLIPIFVYLSQTPQFDEITAKTPQLRAWWDEVKNLDSVSKICA